MKDNEINKSMDNKMDFNSTNFQTKKQPDERGGIHVQGHIKIFDPETKEVFIDKRNAIHYENMSVAMVNSLSNQGQTILNVQKFIFK